MPAETMALDFGEPVAVVPLTKPGRRARGRASSDEDDVDGDDLEPARRRVVVHPTGGVEVMGVAPGDTLTASYHSYLSSPYIVHTSSLHWLNFSSSGYLNVAYEPLLGITAHNTEGQAGYFNDIWQDGDGRYFFGHHWSPEGLVPNELFVQRTGTRDLTLDTTAPPPRKERYGFVPGVDYGAGYGFIWQCRLCPASPTRSTDFNSPEYFDYTIQSGRPTCPACQRSIIHQFDMIHVHGPVPESERPCRK